MYDVTILGGGPAGYLAAERLGQAGRRVLLVEKSELGGTCLNIGCIPTKTLLHCAKTFVHAGNSARFGVKASEVSYDWLAMQAWKDDVVKKLRDGIASQLKRFQVTIVNGHGELIANNQVRVTTADYNIQDYHSQAVLVATGSRPIQIPIPGAKDNPLVVDSTGLLAISAPPRRLAVIGGGVIGLEFAGLFAALGSSVTVVELLDEIVPFMDKDQAPLLRRAMKGVDFKLSHSVEQLEGANLVCTSPSGNRERVEADLVLMAVGRRPILAGWGAEKLGLAINAGGLLVDDRMRTNLPGIWAAGDVTGRSLLAHSAYRMAEVAAADILDQLTAWETGPAKLGEATNPSVPDATSRPASRIDNRMRYEAIPWVVYGLSEAAGVGLTEQQALAQKLPILTASLPMKLSGRFAAENGFAGQGAVKLIAQAPENGRHPDEGRIIGIHAVGAYASEFIWGAAAIIEQELRVADLKQIIFPHPSVAELIREAAWALK